MLPRLPRPTLILGILTLLLCNVALAHPFPHSFRLPDLWVESITPNRAGQPVYGSVYRMEARNGFEGIWDAFNGWTNPKGVSFCFAYRTKPTGGNWSDWSARVWETSGNHDNAYEQYGQADVVTGNWPAGTQVQFRTQAKCLFDRYSDWVEGSVLTVANTPPMTPTQVAINPLPPRADQDITATASGSTDPDGQSISYRYKWWLRGWNGVHTMQYEGNPLPASYTVGNQVWFCEAVAYDGTDTSNADRDSPQFTIANSPPTTPTGITITPAQPRTADNIVAAASGSTDPDNSGVVIVDAISYEYMWLRHEGDVWTLRATGNTLNADLTTKGETWYVRYRAADSHGGYSAWTYSNDFTIGNTAPTKPTTVTIKPEAPNEDQNLIATASGSTDIDGDRFGYTYQWVRFAGRLQIPGPEGRTLNASETSPGQYWAARARAGDSTNVSDWKYSALVQITDVEHAPTAPTSVVVTPASPLDSDSLQATASGSTDADGTTPTYRYQWSRSIDRGTTWAAWSDGTNALDASSTAVGEWWKARACATDGVLSSGWRESNVVAILGSANTPPTALTSLTLTPENPIDTDNLVLTAAGSTDPDGGNITYQYDWSKSTDNGATWSAWSRGPATMGAAATTPGEKWKGRARGADGTLVGPWRVSSIVTIAYPNRPPTALTSLTISPANPFDTDDLVLTAAGSTDPDGGAITYQYEWCKSTDSGATWSAWTRGPDRIGAAATTPGNQWRARARGADGTLVGAWRESNVVTIGGANTPPTALTSLTLTPASPVDADNLVLTAAGSTDPDGIRLIYQYEWSKSTDNGTTWSVWSRGPAAMGVSATTVGERWKGRARGADGALVGPWRVSNIVTIVAARAVASAATTVSAAQAPGGNVQVVLSLSAPAAVQVIVTNVAGRTIAVLPTTQLVAGTSNLLWNRRSANGTQVPDGTYCLRVRSVGSDGSTSLCATTLQLR